MQRLCRIARKRVRVVVGLMSGTSHDGVDAAVARISGSGARARVELISHSRLPYPERLRERVSEAFDGPTALVCGLNFELGEFFARAALKAIAEAGLEPGDVDLIGSHGQTIYHIPPGKRHKPSSGTGAAGHLANKPVTGSTLQIGEGAVIARLTGIVTVTDFRTADMAMGGQGAPLVPMADWVLFREKGKVIALQNIGGIANVTVVPERLEGVTGFDTGPGCSLLDETVRIMSRGKLSMDRGGKLARSGEIIPELLHNLISNPYFRQKPPKSTGREEFGRAMAGRIAAKYSGSRVEDVLCTLTHLTARSIHRAYEDFVFPATPVDRIVLSGGGAKNLYLVSLLREFFQGVPVAVMDGLGIPAQSREAICFAVLANETASGSPGNVPAVTGAGGGAILGKISL